ncbi:MAG TPA: ABC transporter permease [Pseudolabrys sp.]|nr:ABC transporter permease [Pseudolabrys sp.]
MAHALDTPKRPETARPSADGRRFWSDAAKSNLAFVLFVLALALIWEATARLAGFNRLLFPSLLTVFQRLGSMLASGELFNETLATLWKMTLGYAIGIVVAVPLGLAMGRSRLMEDLFGPIINFLLPIPVLVLVPLFVLWMGLTLQAAVSLIALASALPIAVNTWSGSRGIEPQMLRVAQSVNITGLELFRKVLLPASLPSIIIGLRQGLALAWRAAIGAEFFAVSSTGLGVRMFEAKDYVQMDVILSMLLVIMALSMIFDKLIFAPLEARTIGRWGVGNNS